MSIQTSKIEVHWNYFLAIERDLDVISRFVEFDQRNFDCFSIEIAKVLVAASGEIDVIAKQICRAIDTASTAQNIYDYRNAITTRYPQIPTFGVEIPRYGLSLHPWDEWKEPNGVPLW